LSLLSLDGVEGTYRTAYADCRLERDRFPPAAAIQQLVGRMEGVAEVSEGVAIRGVLSPSSASLTVAGTSAPTQKVVEYPLHNRR
jgi:hypothetical protein